MDPKKQELNPELKEIYDRVMNTQVKSPSSPTSVSAGVPQPVSLANAQSDPTPIKHVDPFASVQSAPTSVSAPQSGAPQPGASASAQSAPFVFTGNKVTTPQEPTAFQSQTSTNKKISTPIIAVLVVVLIVVWALFWAKFFGLI
ncbi:MAG: hypothetical protein HY427_00355 [Candidatus Levybacteria bacterium]|nr:hypothetical protein [Candidatus Levybacteria bacterium]